MINNNNGSDGTASDVIAGWINRLKPEDIPGQVRLAAANTVIDTIGLIIAALETDYGRAVRKAWPDGGECTVFGSAEPCEMAAAAVINGTCGHGEDFDNTFEGCPVHSGVVIVPALTAAGEHFKLKNSDIAKGLVVGIEIMCRLGLVAQKGIHTAGFHPTAILGTMAATAGVAAATHQSAPAIRNSLGVAGSMAAGIIEYLADGSWTKRLHAGWAAQTGLRAAMMGNAGFVGPGTVFEGTHGLFKAFAPTVKPDFNLLTEGLGEHWASANVAFKPYACGTMAQPYVDCAVQLAKHGIDPDDIEEIVCEVGEGTVHRLWEPLELKRRPPTAYAAKFSVPYCVAVGFLTGDAGLAQYTEETIRNDRILDLARKVGYVIDPNNEYPRNYSGHVRARLKNGTVIEERQAQLRGGSRQPLTRNDLINKCKANLAFAGWPKERVTDIVTFADAIMNVDAPFNALSLRTP